MIPTFWPAPDPVLVEETRSPEDPVILVDQKKLLKVIEHLLKHYRDHMGSIVSEKNTKEEDQNRAAFVALFDLQQGIAWDTYKLEVKQA
jgi:hypothetical protein